MAQSTQGKFSKILVAVDGSEKSMEAADYAISMSKKENNSQLIGLTVLDITKLSYLSASFITAPTYGITELEQKKKEAQQWLDQIGTHAKENNIPYKSEIIEGPVSVKATIVDYVEREKIDLILMGTRGRSGFTKMLLGSVASKVVTYSPCPVMIVK